MAARTGADAEAMRNVWNQAVTEVKRQVNSTALFRALERTVPVAWEDDFFVIGFATMDGQMASQLNTPQTQSTIERVLRDMLSRPELRFRVIEGTHYEDWEHTRQRDAAAEQNRQQFAQKRVVESSAFGSWEEIYEQVSRLWANFEYRNQATGRGRYLDQALEMISKAMDNLYPAEGKAPEPIERGLARVIERVANMTSSDPVVVAYLLFEKRKK